MKNKVFLAGLLLLFLLAGCGTQSGQTNAGSMNGMMQRHNAPIPDEFAGLVNPIPSDDQSLARGAAIFNSNCSTCHGDGGMGDGPTAAALDPSPPPIAHTSQMSGDDYLFWRITEGGVPFNTAMPVFSTLVETARWDVINYVRALGRGEITPGMSFGGAVFDPEAELLQRAEMLAQAIELGIITEAEADTFQNVHHELDELLATQGSAAVTGNADQIQTDNLAQLVNAGKITQSQAEAFSKVHTLLIEAGLMQ